MKDTQCICKLCGDPYNKKEVSRIYGKESFVFMLNLCSAKCYTDYIINKSKDKDYATGNNI